MALNKEFVNNLLIDVWGWLRSILILLFWDIKKPAIFYGYGVWRFATRYARKRDRRWKRQWNQKGKCQGLFPVEDDKVIICSVLELEFFQKRGMIKRGINVRKYFKRKNYYKTDMYYGNDKQNTKPI